MTAIVRLAFDNKVPLIIGDLMLSGPKKGGITTLIMPTVENAQEIFSTGFDKIPYELHQKIVVLGDNLVIGWSGDHLNATEVIRDLYAENKAAPVTKSALEDYFRSLPEHMWHERDGVGFLGFVKDTTGIVEFGYHHTNLKTKHFGNVGFLGTGTDDLESVIRQFPSIPSSRMGSPNPLQLAASFALGITGSLLAFELATHRTLQNFYGGGYEIASLIGGKFEKVSNVTYLFWAAEISDIGVRISQYPMHVMSFWYQGDILTIRSVYFSDPARNVSTYQANFAIRPMHRMVSQEELAALQIPDLNQKFLCNYFLMTSPSNGIEIYSRVDHAPAGEGPIRMAEEHDKVIISVKHEFIESVLREIYRGHDT